VDCREPGWGRHLISLQGVIASETDRFKYMPGDMDDLSSGREAQEAPGAMNDVPLNGGARD